MKRTQVWKPNHQDQLSLLPPIYDDLVPINPPLRIVNTILVSIEVSSLEANYKGGDTSSKCALVLCIDSLRRRGVAP